MRALVILGLIVASLSWSNRASAQQLQVIPVPWVATDPTVPHLAYNGHPTTFKAIARGGNGSYTVEWDFDGNGVYDFNALRTDRYDLSTTFTYPNQAQDKTFQAQIRVTSNAQQVVATYPVRVFADVPSDPAAATDRQLQVMRSVAVDDGLWYLHKQMVRSGDETNPLTGAQITGYVGSSSASYRNIAAGIAIEAFGRNQRYAAFPDAYLGELPDPALNTSRWRDDPYAEDVARLINYSLTQAVINVVSTTDEVNLIGFYPEITATPIAGTDDSIGFTMGGSSGDGMLWGGVTFLRGLALANLQGYVAQVGDVTRILGRRFEFIAQQLVDGLVWAQNDGGTYPGSWYYFANNGNDMLGEFEGGALGAMEALWQAEQSLSSQGVIVPNFVKTRLMSYIQQNVNNCTQGGTGGTYTSSTNGVCDFALSAAHLFTLGWLEANTFSASDTRLAFPGYTAVTRGQLRSLHDSSLVFITQVFNSTSTGQNNWDIGFVEAADYGRVDGHGNHWSMVQWTRAARAVEPEIVSFGANDHARLFGRYFIRNQAADGGWNWVLTGTLNNHTDNSLGAESRAGWAIITLSPDSMAPVASAQASVLTEDEGTPIAFLGDSYVGQGVTYQWDFDNGDVQSGQSLDYAYPDDGAFDVTLTTTTAGGTSTDTLMVTINNVAPSVDVGSDVTIDEGSAVAFDAQMSDPGVADTHTFAWTFGDSATATTLTSSHSYADDGPYTATLTVEDDDGDSGSDSASITVVNVAPTITSLPNTVTVEGTEFSYTLTFTDPGASDTHSCALGIAPQGMEIDGCEITWTPTLAQARMGEIPVTVCVTDDDDGADCQTWLSATSFIDSDTDGMADSWEDDFFGDLLQADDDDLDGDGITNLDEFLGFTDPTDYDAPGVAIPLSPACGGEVNQLTPELVVANAVDPANGTLDYEFEMYTDATLTTLGDSDTVSEGIAGTTSWTVDGTLDENETYYWRVRASDGDRIGVWSTACAFTVNTSNQAPSVPSLTNPVDEAAVKTVRPILGWNTSHDPEGTAVSYQVQIAESTGFTPVVGQALDVAGNTVIVDVDLTEGTTYYWRARARDTSGIASAYSTPRSFTVAMTPPPLLLPDGGSAPDAASGDPGGDDAGGNAINDASVPNTVDGSISSEMDGAVAAGGGGSSNADSGAPGAGAPSNTDASTSSGSNEDSGGCACSVPGQHTRGSHGGLVALLALTLALRRRRQN